MEEVHGCFREVSAFLFSPELWGELPESAAGMPGLSIKRFQCASVDVINSIKLCKLGMHCW
jgi:hypothetical protein